MSLLARGAWRPRLGDVLAVSLLVVGVGVAVALYGTLPDRLVVHWTLGLGPYYGVRTLPKTVTVVGLSALATGVYAVLRAPLLVGDRNEGLGPMRRLYDAFLVGSVATVVAALLFVVLVNGV